jgi:hypothetical protein
MLSGDVILGNVSILKARKIWVKLGEHIYKCVNPSRGEHLKTHTHTHTNTHKHTHSLTHTPGAVAASHLIIETNLLQ